MSMLVVACRLLAFALSATAMAQLPAGYITTAFPNPTGQGSGLLTARVYYPALSAGFNAPLRVLAGGYPVIVFLHGYGGIGSFYTVLGKMFAEAGYVVVLGNTAQFSASTQVLDGRALFPALQHANSQAGTFLEGALDMSRAGVCGHSMGGGSTVNVLLHNPGYAAGFCFAPVSASSAAVRVPLGVVHGTGDTTLAWASTGQAVYQQATNYTGMKVFYLLDNSCNHTNVAGLSLSSQTSLAVWTRCAAVAVGFFGRFLNDEPGGLEEIIGPAGRAEPRLAQVSVEVETPDVWQVGAAAIGQSTRISMAAEPGIASIFAAAGTYSVATPFGTLLLDPATLAIAQTGTIAADRLLSITLSVPNTPALIGARVYFQAAGATRNAAIRLGARAGLTIEP
jgi:dienelactone hydrolase